MSHKYTVWTVSEPGSRRSHHSWTPEQSVLAGCPELSQIQSCQYQQGLKWDTYITHNQCTMYINWDKKHRTRLSKMSYTSYSCSTEAGVKIEKTCKNKKQKQQHKMNWYNLIFTLVSPFSLCLYFAKHTNFSSIKCTTLHCLIFPEHTARQYFKHKQCLLAKAQLSKIISHKLIGQSGHCRKLLDNTESLTPIQYQSNSQCPLHYCVICLVIGKW